ncbi:hypothetical protein ABFS83_01G047800 [Erythranthe nasuta]
MDSECGRKGRQLSPELGGGGDYHYHHLNPNQRHLFFNHHLLKVVVMCAMVTLTSFMLYQASESPFQILRRSIYSSFSFSSHAYHSVCNSSSVNEENELEKTLKSAAMKDNRTVIITTLNAAWTEPNSIFDLFLESFKIGNGTQDLLKHVLVVALDQKAYSRCLEVRLHCHALTTEGIDFSGEAHFMSEDYLKMMWRRIDFLHTVLQLGYDFVFTDADVMWLRNPFERFHPDGDFQIACDHYWFNYTDLNNSPNGGFNYVKSNNRTIQFYKFWHTGRDYFPGKHDQDVLDVIKMNPFIKRIGLEMRFLDTAEFGGFCEPSKDLDRVVTMHANCCIGMENKIHDIKMVIDDWKRYNISIPIGGERNLSTRFWTVPRICG